MIFYQVLGTSSAPCCLVGTQVDAKRLAKERGTSWEQVDVPTDKNGLMEYVNQLKAGINAEMHHRPNEEINESLLTLGTPYRPDATADRTVCPRCKFDHVSAKRYAEANTKLATTDARVAWIEQADAGQLGDLAAAVAQRFEQMGGRS
jgi:hypothetical protein